MFVWATGPARHYGKGSLCVLSQKRTHGKLGGAEAGQMGKRIQRPVDIIEPISRHKLSDRNRLETMGELWRHGAYDLKRILKPVGECGFEGISDMADAAHDREPGKSVRC
ncbi:hypothetical protein Sbs19_37310 [Sphingobium sp. BS19]|nr:hypothetical protein Sbs19_37310 [Sphingobium sp. BS19]